MKAGWMERPLNSKLNKNREEKRFEKIVRRWLAKHPLPEEARHALTGE